MPEKKKPDLIDRIIREVACNRELSQKAIDEKAGFSSNYSREDKLLKPWIQEEKNTRLVFDKSICWRNESLTSMRGTKIRPDLVGTDSNGRYVIVEVKFKFNFPNDKKQIRTDPEKKAIGQIFLYASAFMRKYPAYPMPRLFIVSIDFSKDVDDVCKKLCSKGIDLQHIAIENKLCK